MAAPISVGMSAVSMMSLMPTAMPRSGPSFCARGLAARNAKAPISFSRASIALSDCANAASGDISPLSIRRLRSTSEIMEFPWGFLRDRYLAARLDDGEGRDKPDLRHGPPSPRAAVAPLSRPQGANVDAVNQPTKLTEAERIDRLRLIRSDNVGPR